MIPSEGLIGSFAGQMAIVAGLIVVGFLVGYLPVMSFIVARYKPQGKTQTNLMTGLTEQSIHWWAARVAAFTMGGQVLLGVVLTLIEAVNRLNAALPYWWIILGLLGVCAVCVWIYRRFGKRLDRAYEPPVEEPVFEDQGAADLPVQPWGLPEGMPQWDQR